MLLDRVARPALQSRLSRDKSRRLGQALGTRVNHNIAYPALLLEFDPASATMLRQIVTGRVSSGQGQASAAVRAREIGYCGIASGVVDRGFATPTPLRSIRIPPRFFGPPCAFRHPPPSMRTPPRFLGGRRVSIYLLFSGLTTKNAKALQAAKCFEPSPRMTSLHLS
jgi:hypothetical protein